MSLGPGIGNYIVTKAVRNSITSKKDRPSKNSDGELGYNYEELITRNRIHPVLISGVLSGNPR
jgi:hypothetical protein